MWIFPSFFVFTLCRPKQTYCLIITMYWFVIGTYRFDIYLFCIQYKYDVMCAISNVNILIQLKFWKWRNNMWNSKHTKIVLRWLSIAFFSLNWVITQRLYQPIMIILPLQQHKLHNFLQPWHSNIITCTNVRIYK